MRTHPKKKKNKRSKLNLNFFYVYSSSEFLLHFFEYEILHSILLNFFSSTHFKLIYIRPIDILLHTDWCINSMESFIELEKKNHSTNGIFCHRRTIDGS